MKKRKKIEEDAKRVVLPNAKNGIEIKEDAKYAKQLVSAMSSAYEVEDFWKIMGMLMFTSKNDFTIQDYPNTPFKIYIVYSNVNHKLSIRYKINGEETNEFTQTGHRWLEGRGVKVGEALKLIKDSGFLPPSVESISEVNGDDIFDDLRIELSKYTDDSEDEEPTNIIKMNVKENKNMGQQVIRINENQLRQIVTESVKKILKESTNEGLFNWGKKNKQPQQQPVQQTNQQQNGGLSKHTQDLINWEAQEIVSRARQHRFFNWDENTKAFLKQDPNVYAWVCKEIEKAKSQQRQPYA